MPAQVEVAVDLPSGHYWTHLFTGRRYEPGRVAIGCDLLDPPVMLVRSGAVVTLSDGPVGFGVTSAADRIVVCPPAGDATISWSHHDVRLRDAQDGPVCRGTVATRGTIIDVTIEFAEVPDRWPTLALPIGEQRAVVVHGARIESDDIDGWRVMRLGPVG